MRIGVGTTEAKVTYSSTLSSTLISETWSPLLGWDANANATLRDGKALGETEGATRERVTR
jgi:hypothetical protein